MRPARFGVGVVRSLEHRDEHLRLAPLAAVAMEDTVCPA
jgi:hypothetical protein